MGKQLKIKSGKIVLVNKKKIDRFPPKKEEVRVKKVSSKNENDNCLNCLYLFIYLFIVPALLLNLAYFTLKTYTIPPLLTGLCYASSLIPITIHIIIVPKIRKRKKKISAKKVRKEFQVWKENNVMLKRIDGKVRHYKHGERLHPDEWYEEKCSYCGEIMQKTEDMCKFCGHDKRPIEVIEKRSRTIPKTVQREVWRRDFGRCVECGSKERLEYDHIIPFSKGGSNTARNIQLLCEKCNRKKHDKI